MERYKRVLMFLFSLPIAVASGLTGIGGQVAGTPMIQFMLGYAPGKAAATGILFAFAAAASACIVMMLNGASTTLGQGLLAGLGVFVGVMLSGKAAGHSGLLAVRRFGQVFAIVLGLFVVATFVNANRSGFPAYVAQDVVSLTRLALVAGVCGLLSGLLQVSGGILFVPAAMFLLGMPPKEAICLSLLVIALAASLPALGGLSSAELDRSMASALLLAGLAGGGIGGWIATVVSGHALVLPGAFGVAAMLMSAYVLSKLGEAPGKGNSPQP
jgi:uncharacterized membrane protein YfcA